MLRPTCGTLMLTLLLIVQIPTAYGDDLTLLADLGSTSSIYNLAAVGDGLYFCGVQSATGSELWTSDGTPAGTYLVLDINPGTGHADPMHFGDLNGVALFQANDGVHYAELWRSAATAASTWLVKDIWPYYHSSPSYLTPYNGAVYFQALGENGVELYRTDGTEAGTVVVKDINPGTGGSGPRDFVEMGGILYFAADNGTTGYELWKTDGTEAGTVLVKNINQSYGSTPYHLTPVGSTLFFSADDGVNGRQLWKTDGTETGTVMVKDVWPGPDMVAFNGQLFFAATLGTTGQELWRSDGTEAGTIMVKDINPFGSAHVDDLEVVDGTLFFHAHEHYTGRELWKSDGTESGTVMVKDICPGYSGSWPYGITAYCGKVYFGADDGTTGYELWVSDGSEEGTVLVQDFAPGSASSLLSFEPVVSGGLLFFNVGLSTGAQLWVLESGSAAIAENHDRGQPGGLTLGQNYPNPFRPVTTINYSVPVASNVELTIHDAGGRLVVTLLNTMQRKGEYSSIWDGRSEPGQKVDPGVYFARLRSDGQCRTRKITLVK